ncbi:hypothetical protein P4C99_21405 [Pontiellaceae bacterium B1224]|nr:hypothetical protein [Pontiellaceae bacterium B1224]
MNRTIFMILVFSLITAPVHAGREKLYKFVYRVFAGLATAKAAEATVHADELYRFESEIADKLRQAGVNPQSAAIYSLYIKMDSSNHYFRSADFFGNPDLMIFVQIEGKGGFLVPHRWNGYSGQAVLEQLIAVKASAGDKVIIHFLDDDSFMNTSLNSLLSKPINVRVGVGFQCSPAIVGSASADGTIQLVDRECVIKAPNYLGSVEFKVPHTLKSVWVVDGKIVDNDGVNQGSIQFAQLWVAPKFFASRGKLWFCGILVIVFVSMFAKSMFTKASKK